tara:strand:+ start:223 stop:432 length:210 start_codon:yes stop_codon:yes gene_type:complete
VVVAVDHQKVVAVELEGIEPLVMVHLHYKEMFYFYNQGLSQLQSGLVVQEHLHHLDRVLVVVITQYSIQ